MSETPGWKRRAEAAGYNPALLARLAAARAQRPTGGALVPVKRSRTKPMDPLCMVNHPERGRFPQRISTRTKQLVYTDSWIADESHPLGGYAGTVTLYRHVNLRRDVLPGWYARMGVRPLYEFTRERP